MNALLDSTYELLEASTLTLPEIAAGAEVNYHWLSKFKQKTYSDPGVNRVERLHHFLSRQVDAGDAA